jgi:chromate transport protein ChrA
MAAGESKLWSSYKMPKQAEATQFVASLPVVGTWFYGLNPVAITIVAEKMSLCLQKDLSSTQPESPRP